MRASLRVHSQTYAHVKFELHMVFYTSLNI